MNSSIIDPLLCPLCQQQNRCENLGDKDTNKTCWCNNPDIKFPKALLDQVPKDKKGKACICQNCAKVFNQTHNKGTQQFDPSE